MQIDSVHELQGVYRELLHSMSRPGTVSTLQEYEEQLDYNLPCNNATFLLVLTLFDAEVSFHLLPEHRTDVVKRISDYTFARYTTIDDADFVIALNEASESEVIHAMKLCKTGNLLDPEKSTTWIIESDQIEKSSECLLTGPGIKREEHLQVNFSNRFWETRNERTKEYPLGIEVIFTDDMSQIVCVPRTTVVKGGGD